MPRSSLSPLFDGVRRAGAALGPGTRALMVACAALTTLFSVTTFWHLYPFGPAGGDIIGWPAEWLAVNPTTLPSLRLTALATNGLVAAPTGLTGLVFLGLIMGFFLQDRVRGWWRTHRVQLIAIPIAVLLVVGVADRVLLPGGFASGLLGSLLVVGWLAASLERGWGQRRLLTFSAVVMVGSNLVGALVLWGWPDSYLAAFGSTGSPTMGTQPLMVAIMATQGFTIGRRQLSIIPLTGRQLVWLLVAIGVLDVLLRGVASGLIQLSAIGLAWLLVSGNWRPRYAVDRVRLYLIDRRLARRRRGFEVIDGGRPN